MGLSNREIVELVSHGGERSMPATIRTALEERGAVTLELDDWFVDIDETHSSVKIELDGVPDLRAEMPVEEFLAHADEIAGH